MVDRIVIYKYPYKVTRCLNTGLYRENAKDAYFLSKLKWIVNSETFQVVYSIVNTRRNRIYDILQTRILAKDGRL